MNQIKNMIIYMDNSCEVHFDTSENSRILMSPCGSEFIYRTYAPDNTIQSEFLNIFNIVFGRLIFNPSFCYTDSLKYRTAYPISLFADKLKIILAERNKYCNDRPFISSIFIENSENSYWVS